MDALDPDARNDSCPWCGEPITDRSDSAVVRPNESHVDPARFHSECATEWARFIERARSLACRGARHQLLLAPLEKGFEVESPESATTPR